MFAGAGGTGNEIMEAVMTVRLELKPDIEANLTAQARAKAGPAASPQEIEAILDRLAEMGRD